jgi:hypothetical protein
LVSRHVLFFFFFGAEKQAEFLGTPPRRKCCESRALPISRAEKFGELFAGHADKPSGRAKKLAGRSASRERDRSLRRAPAFEMSKSM